jgi:hypothetical protein
MQIKELGHAAFSFPSSRRTLQSVIHLLTLNVTPSQAVFGLAFIRASMSLRGVEASGLYFSLRKKENNERRNRESKC